MWQKPDWRQRPTSTRHKLATALSQGQDSLRVESISRARQLVNFFRAFWLATPHPIAQVVATMYKLRQNRTVSNRDP